jgi:uncharacterized membrane protein
VFLSPSTTLVFIIIRKHRDVIDADEQACEGANLKELLALSNPYRCVELVGRGCITLQPRCDCCKHFLIPGNSFSSTVTGRLFSFISEPSSEIRKTSFICKAVGSGGGGGGGGGGAPPP